MKSNGHQMTLHSVDFDFLRSRLQEFLVEEREDANARSLNNP